MKEPGLFYEYAITPEVFGPAFLTENEVNPVVITRLLHDICENGMISNLHNSGWHEDIRRRIGGIPSQKIRKDLQKLLFTLKGRQRLVRHPKALNGPNNCLEWLELAREAHRRAPLDAIMLTPELLKRSSMKDVPLLAVNHDALYSSVWRTRKRSKTIKQREQDYRCLLRKILRHARELDLIDPYFSPPRNNNTDNKWTEMIKICASLMGQHGGERSPIIRIHTGDPSKQRLPEDECSPEEEKKAWKSWGKAEFSQKFRHKLSVTMWRKKSADSERMHDRFLITDQVGFSVAGGLDCLPSHTSSDTMWTLIDEEDRRLWLDKFGRKEMSPYKKISTVLIAGWNANNIPDK